MRKGLFLGIGLVVAVGGWLAFRPELLFVDKEVSESLPGAAADSGDRMAEPRTIASGKFHDGAHKTSGTAAILAFAGGQRILRLADFSTSNGPDVQVYLGVAPDALDSETVTRAGFVRLGALKGNVGDQNYEIPADVDLSKYHSVTIWCQRFGVNFGTAPLVGAAR